MKHITVAVILLALAPPAFAQEQAKETVKPFTYKKTKQADLAIHVHFPPAWKKDDKRPAIVFFFGGGWTSGTVNQFEPQASYLPSRGMVAARADYRVKSRHDVTPDAWTPRVLSGGCGRTPPCWASTLTGSWPPAARPAGTSLPALPALA
jgi:hypothetical protein